MASWRESFFRKGVFTPGMAEARRAAPREASFVWKALSLRPNARLLDVCCGTGRHAVPLARRGALVTGIDFKEEYLAEARRAGRGLAGLRFSRQDMRRLPYRGEFDAACNLWTSFGYFEKPGDDLATLRSIARSLKPGGLFLLDILDFAWLKKNYEPLRCEQQADGAWRLEQVTLRGGSDPAMLSRWTFFRPGRPPTSSDLFVRGYDEPRLSALLRRAGLSPVRRWSSLDGRRSGPRLVLLSRKS